MMNTRAGAVGLALAILLSLGGLALTGLMLDYHVKDATGGTPLAKTLGEALERPLANCGTLCSRLSLDEAMHTSWARLSFGEWSIPTALVAFIYFVAVSAWFLIVGRPSGARYSWHWFAVILTAIGAGLAGFLAWRARGLATISPLWAGAEILAGLVFIFTLLIWPRRRLVAVMAEPVSGPSRTPVPVRVPVPDYPPSRALLAWVLTTVGIAALGYVGYDGIVNGQLTTKKVADLSATADQADQAARKNQQEAQAARDEAAAARTQVDKATAELKTAQDQLKAAQEQVKTAEAQRVAMAGEMEKLKTAAEPSERALKTAQAALEKAQAELVEAKYQAQQAAAKLKDYEDDYQAVWFNFMNEPVLNVQVDQTDSIRGKVDAPHTIVMFMDLQCPFCQGADKMLRQKLAKYPNQLRLVVKHFPLDKSCNQKVMGTVHPTACPAAVTVEAARAVGGEDAFWKMYDELFAHQADFAKSPRDFVKAACERIGISNDDLWKKINTTSVWDRVKVHTEQGGTCGVDGTPAVFYDGRKVAGWANSKFWDFIMWRETQGMGAPASTQPAQTTQPAEKATTQPQ